MGTETGDLNVVPQQVGILRNFIYRAAEKLLLKIKAWPPSQVRADFQILAFHLPNHVRGEHAFGRFLIMSAAGGMNMMIAGPPTHDGRIDPTLGFKRQVGRIWLDRHEDGLRD